MEDIKDSTQICSSTRFSGSVLMEIQLRSLLEQYDNLEGSFVVLPVTLTNGSIAIANFNTTVWPAWIRPAIRSKLLNAGGVPSESPLQILTDSKGKVSVQPVKKLDTSSTVTPVEPATDDDDPKSSPTL